MARSAYAGYGSLPTFASDISEPPQWKRKSINLYAAFIAFIVPFGIFCAIFAACSLLPFYYPWCNNIIIGINAALILCIFFYLVDAHYGKVSSKSATSKGQNHPMWISYNVAFSSVALMLGCFLGRYNYATNMLPYFVMNGLNFYPTVDPLLTRGQMVMDGGIFNFTADSVLDLLHAMAFRGADDVYCVSPISVSGPNATLPAATLPTYDFWAVGLNCCNGDQGQQFKCGDYDNTDARGGLRVLKDEQTPYFRLAVQQAEAAYNIKATYPIFMYWMEDPKAETDAYMNDGMAFLLNGILIAGIVHFSITSLVVLVLAKFAD